MNGKETEILKVNGILRGLSVPSGKNEIEFIYDKSSFSSGLIMSFISLGLLFGMIIIGSIKGKRDE